MKEKANRIISIIVITLLLLSCAACDKEKETISTTACDKEKITMSTKMEKGEIIDLFEKNSDHFIRVVEYIENEGYEHFYCAKNFKTGDVKISNEGRSIEINDKQVMESLLFIIEELEFSGIYGGINHYIRFVKESSVEAKGILYFKGDTMPVFIFESEKIMDNWYYYMTVNP